MLREWSWDTWIYHYRCTSFFTTNTLCQQEIWVIFRVPIRTCWPLNIFNNSLVIVQSFPLLTILYESFPISLSVWQVQNTLNDRLFQGTFENGWMKRIPICFAQKDTKWMQKFLNGKKLNFLLPTTSAAYHFPKDLTFKLVLHGFTKEWKSDSKQLSSRTSEVKNATKY